MQQQGAHLYTPVHTPVHTSTHTCTHQYTHLNTHLYTPVQTCTRYIVRGAGVELYATARCTHAHTSTHTCTHQYIHVHAILLGELVELYGLARVTLNPQLKIKKIDVQYKPGRHVLLSSWSREGGGVGKNSFMNEKLYLLKYSHVLK